MRITVVFVSSKNMISCFKRVQYSTLRVVSKLGRVRLIYIMCSSTVGNCPGRSIFSFVLKIFQYLSLIIIYCINSGCSNKLPNETKRKQCIMCTYTKLYYVQAVSISSLLSLLLSVLYLIFGTNERSQQKIEERGLIAC